MGTFSAGTTAGTSEWQFFVLASQNNHHFFVQKIIFLISLYSRFFCKLIPSPFMEIVYLLHWRGGCKSYGWVFNFLCLSVVNSCFYYYAMLSISHFSSCSEFELSAISEKQESCTTLALPNQRK